MADGTRQHGFGFHTPGASKLRQGEIVVDLFSGVDLNELLCNASRRNAWNTSRTSLLAWLS